MKPILRLLLTFLTFPSGILGQELNYDVTKLLFTGHIMNESMIMKLKEYPDLSTHSLTQIDSTFFRSDGVKTLILAHKSFNTKGWVASGLKSTEPTPNYQPQLAGPIYKYRVQMNYFFEVDSTGHVLYFFNFDQFGEIIPLSYSENALNAIQTAILEYYYNDKGRIEYAQAHNRYFGISDEWGNASLLKFKWKDTTLQKVEFHNLYRKTGEWIIGQCIKNIPLLEPVSDNQYEKITSFAEKTKRSIDSVLHDFPADSVLTNCYWQNYMYQFAHDEVNAGSCSYLLYKKFSSVVLSDTIGRIIRYIWLMPDDHSYTFYVQHKKLIKIIPKVHSVYIRNEENKRLSYPMIQACYALGKKDYYFEEYLDITDDVSTSSYYISSYVNYKNAELVYPENLEEEVMDDFYWYEHEFNIFMKERIHLENNHLFSDYQQVYKKMLEMINQ